MSKNVHCGVHSYTSQMDLLEEARSCRADVITSSFILITVDLLCLGHLCWRKSDHEDPTQLASAHALGARHICLVETNCMAQLSLLAPVTTFSGRGLLRTIPGSLLPILCPEYWEHQAVWHSRPNINETWNCWAVYIVKFLSTVRSAFFAEHWLLWGE